MTPELQMIFKSECFASNHAGRSAIIDHLEDGAIARLNHITVRKGPSTIVLRERASAQGDIMERHQVSGQFLQDWRDILHVAQSVTKFPPQQEMLDIRPG